MADDDFNRIYQDRKYSSCRLLTHAGVTICFALGQLADNEHSFGKHTDSGAQVPSPWALFYTILDLNSNVSAQGRPQEVFDNAAWLTQPKRVPFPAEVRYVDAAVMPTHKLNTYTRTGKDQGQNVPYAPTDVSADCDYFRSSTAVLASQDSDIFRVLSDGDIIYLFRESRASTDRLTPKSTNGTLVDSNLLVDRYSLIGTQLSVKHEMRFQLSERKGIPQSEHDSMSITSTNGAMFIEPTTILSFISKLRRGMFEVLRLPSLGSSYRWNILACVSGSAGIHSYNLDTTLEGGFVTSARVYYTCENEEHQPYYADGPGTCNAPVQDQMRCGRVLVAVPDTTPVTQPAVILSGASSKAAVEPANGPIDLVSHDNGFTLEFWMQPIKPILSVGSAEPGAGKITHQPIVSFGTDNDTPITLCLDEKDFLFLDGLATDTTTAKAYPAIQSWYHVALIYNRRGDELNVLVNGIFQANFKLHSKIASLTRFGARISINKDVPSEWFTGILDEIRLWSLLLDPTYVSAFMKQRNCGLHKRLIGCWRCDEGHGFTLFDLTDVSGPLQIKYDSTIDATRLGFWSSTPAPLVELGGLSHQVLRSADLPMEAGSGLSACLYFTQDDADLALSVGDVDKPKNARPGDLVKRLGRVALCFFANGNRKLVLLDYAVSDKGHVASGPGIIELATKSIEDAYTDQDDRSPATVLDLDLVHVDGSGMTIHGVVIDMLGQITGGVELVESAAGKVMIYFGIGEGQLSCLHYDTCLSYKPNVLDLAGGGKIIFFPKIDSITTLVLKITASALLPIYALDLVITGTTSCGKTVEETWLNLPRSAQDFMLALNGLPEDQRKGRPFPNLGKGTAIAPSDASSKTWSVMLKQALTNSLRAGTCLQVGSGQRFQLLKESAVGASSLTGCHLLNELHDGVTASLELLDVEVLGYDFAQLASSAKVPHADFSKGSHLLGFRGINTSALVTPVTKEFEIKGVQRRLTSHLRHPPPSFRDRCAVSFVEPNNLTEGGHSLAAEMWFRLQGLAAGQHVPSYMLQEESRERALLYYYDQEVVAAPQLEARVQQSCIIGLKPDPPQQPPSRHKYMLNGTHASKTGRWDAQHGFMIEFWAHNYTTSDALSCEFSPAVGLGSKGIEITVGSVVKASIEGYPNKPSLEVQFEHDHSCAWHHYAFLFDPSAELLVLVDGIECGRQKIENWLPGGWFYDSLKLRNLSGAAFKTSFAEFRVWSTSNWLKPRTTDDIKGCMYYRLPTNTPGLAINLKPVLDGSNPYNFAPPIGCMGDIETRMPELYDLHCQGDNTLFAIVNGIRFALPKKIGAGDTSWHHLAITQTRTPAVMLTGDQSLKITNPTAAMNLGNFTVALSLTIRGETRPSSTIFKRSDGQKCSFELRRLSGGAVRFVFTTKSEGHEAVFGTNVQLSLNKPYHLYFSRTSNPRSQEQLTDHVHTLVLLPSSENLNSSILEQRALCDIQTVTTAAPVDSASGSLYIGVNEHDAYTEMDLAWIRFYGDSLDYKTIIAKPEESLSAAWKITSTTEAELKETKSGDMVAVISPGRPKFTLSSHSDDHYVEVLYDALKIAHADLAAIDLSHDIHPIPSNKQGEIHRQLTLGGGCPDPADRFAGRLDLGNRGWIPAFDCEVFLDEVRLWPFARSRSQILDEMYGRVQDAQAQMIGYFQAEGQQDDVWNDSSAGGHKLIFDQTSPRHREWIDPMNQDRFTTEMVYATSYSPVNDTPPVIQDYLARKAQAGVFVRKTLTTSRPTLCEYGSVDISKSSKGSWNLLLGWIDKGSGHLVLRTSFRVGTLTSDFVSNLSIGNSLVGYIEGAPPIPGENYMDASRANHPSSSVNLTKSDQVTVSYSRRSETSNETKADLTVGLGIEWDVRGGVGVETEVSKGHIKGHVRTALDVTDSQLSNESGSFQVTESLDRSQTSSARQMQDQWNFDNWGQVYFEGRNANLYALRLQLRDRQPLVAYRIEPSKDEPETHVRNFKINPYYTKQGTLDGMVGNDWDVQYRHMKDQEERSYYRPKEAQMLKDQIKADHIKMESDYHNVKVSLLGQLREAILRDDTIAKRIDATPVAGSKGMYSDCMWTPHGVSILTRSESDTINIEVGGNWRSNWAKGGGVDAQALVGGIGPSSQLEITETLSSTKTLTHDNIKHKSWDLHTSVDSVVDLSAMKGGSVLAYSFTTFFLPQSNDAFDHFFKTVVDPLWLEEPNNLVAEELRDARSTGKTGAWRIFHRVTERVRQKNAISGDPASNNDPVKKDPLPAGVDAASNAELVRYLLPLINFTQLLPIDEPSKLVGAIAGPLHELFPMLKYASSDGLVMALANLLMAYVVGRKA